jgi:hypothetical protein
VGFEHIETNRKVNELEAHRGKGGAWLVGASGDELSRFVDRAKRLSGSLRIGQNRLRLVDRSGAEVSGQRRDSVGQPPPPDSRALTAI